MILVGSQAAYRRGVLPTWRNGVMTDYDIHATDEERELLVSHLKGQYREKLFSHLSPENVLFLAAPNLAVFIYPLDTVSIAIQNCTDNITEPVFGVPCLIISPLTQLALKLAYIRGTKVHQLKNEQDIVYWESVVMNQVDEQHLEVFDAMWLKAERLFNLESSDPRTSIEFKRLINRKLESPIDLNDT